MSRGLNARQPPTGCQAFAEGELEVPAEPVEAAISAATMAKTLGVSYEVVLRLAREGEIPAFQVGNRWRMFPSEVLDHLRAKAPTPTEGEAPLIPRRTTTRAHGPDSPGVRNLNDVDEFLRRIDPHDRLTREATIERLKGAGFM
ncbi:helix-turn-helix domain-containing protein [Microbacterium sp. 11MF]|uniref:helix-turn-helix domain-containing protein n=1 Tax=Microbacterium sp. 11MF TaxID=1169146 RepID=UPI0003702254|nr:helix-turn-helix domain-containing protein [Microbacterium sp. 11MF]